MMVILRVIYQYREENIIKDKQTTILCFSPVNVIAAQLKIGDQVCIYGRIEDKTIPGNDYPVSTAIASHIVAFPKQEEKTTPKINDHVSFGEIFV
jgi:hypothetical protein